MPEPTPGLATEPVPGPDAPGATSAGAPPAHPPARGFLRVTPVIATIGVVVALVGLVLLFRPVQTPTQDCGTSIGFLLDGRVNEFVDPNDLPAGITAAQAESNNTEPCRARVADAAKPAAILIVAGLFTATGAAIAEVTARGLAWRHRARARHQPDGPASPQVSPLEG